MLAAQTATYPLWATFPPATRSNPFSPQLLYNHNHCSQTWAWLAPKMTGYETQFSALNFRVEPLLRCATMIITLFRDVMRV